MPRALLAALTALALLLPTGAHAEPEADCTGPSELSPTQLLRRLSLDLRGRPPTGAEYAEVVAGKSPLDLAKPWLAPFDPERPAPSKSQEDFRQAMRRYHQALLWPNVSNVRVASFGNTLSLVGSLSDGGGYHNPGRQSRYLATNPSFTIKPDTTNYSIPNCDLSVEQPASKLSTDGFKRPQILERTNPDGSREQYVGYRWVKPYWFDPATIPDGGNPDGGWVKVCAFEAQETPTGAYLNVALDAGPKLNPDGGIQTYRDGGWVMASVTVQVDFPLQTPDGGGRADDCGSSSGGLHTTCGCGKDLRWCFQGSVQTDVMTDMTEQLLRVVDRSTVGGKPYTDVLETPVSYVNGRIAWYLQHLSSANNQSGGIWSLPDTDVRFVAPAEVGGAGPGAMPQLSYSDRNWYRVERGRDHAGVLTLPAYLLRFQTNRSRANRFRVDFLCNYFIPPDQLADAPPSCNGDTADLMRKCNCRLCHATLEPLASRWGRFAEAGITRLDTDAGFPDEDPKCAPYPDGGVTSNGRDARCVRFYVNNNAYDEGLSVASGYGGKLKTQLYGDLHTMLVANMSEGPRGLRADFIDNANHDLAHCTVRRLFAHFIRREMRTNGADNDEAQLLETLASEFHSSSYDVPKLVHRLVSLEQYRRQR